MNGQRIGPPVGCLRRQLEVVAASVLLLALGGLAAAPSAVEATTANLAWPAPSGKWEVGNFDSGGGFAFTKAVVVSNRGVGFEFLDRPDTLYLVTEHPAYRGRLLGDLTDTTLTARVGVEVSAGTVFTYFGQPVAGEGGASARFYFATDTPLGTSCPCGIGLSSAWLSDPVRIDLEALKDGASTLTVEMDPAEWIDLASNRGNEDAEHLDHFAQAAADVDTIGLVFGGEGSPHGGVGIADGSGTGSFHLLGVSATR